MKKTFLFLIILLAFLLRLYRLNDYPALNADEAALGYNAFSLLQTGKDEHGHSWPIHFQSFNDYKPGLMVYAIMPFVGLFGLNEWSVRIPGAIAGVLTIFVFYLLIDEIIKRLKEYKAKNITSHLAAFLLAISPWHIHFSRGAWETNLATFLITLAVFLFLKAKDNAKFYFLSFLFFVLSLYTYHSARIIVPLLGVSLLFLEIKAVKKNFTYFVTAAFVSIILCLPLFFDLLKPQATSRLAGVGLFADTGPISRINEQRGQHEDYKKLIPKLIHNKAVNYSLAFFSNWSEHFWGEFLFLSGDEIQRNRVPETGQLYVFELLTVILGFIFLVKYKSEGKIILVWLVISPIAAALTFQSPHALRAQNMVIPLTALSAFGLNELVFLIKNKVTNSKLSKILLLVLVLIISLSFTRYVHMYFVHMSKEYKFSSQYGLSELVEFIAPIRQNYKKIIVTDRYDQPYILFLFYLKYDPREFQKDHELTGRDNYGFSTVRNFSNFEFNSIKYDSVQPFNPGSLIIGTDEEIPKEANIIKKVYGSNDLLYFEIVEN